MRQLGVNVYTIVGIAGFLLYLVPFALVQTDRLDGNGGCYSFTNVAAAVLVLVSLLDQFNLASMLTQSTWIVFGVIGLMIGHRRKSPNRSVQDFRVVVLPPPMTTNWLENEKLLLDRIRRGQISRSELDQAVNEVSISAKNGSADHARLLITVLDASPILRSTIMSIVLNPDDADDALQETLLAVSRSLPSFRGESPVLGWATGIARNKAKDVLRRKGRPVAPDPLDQVPTEHERFTSQWATRTDVERAVAGLSPKLREVFELADMQGHTYLEIATQLGIERNTVASRLRRARAELQLTVAVTAAG